MVDTKHKQYKRRYPEWQLVRDCVEGERAIKEGKERYLPKPNGFDADQFDEYLMRADFFNATGRTIDGLTGMLFRKQPIVYGSDIEEVQMLVDNATRSGKSLYDLANEIADEVMITGRAGVLVDYPRVEEGRTITIAEAQSLGLRPFMKLYPAESIINWRTDIVNGEETLVMVVLEEEHDAEDTGEFEVETELRYRVLTLENAQSDSRFYRIRVMRLETYDEGNRREVVISDDVARMNGQPIRSIPFTMIGPMSQDADPQKSPVLDVATANISHYRTSADIEWGSHKSALPTLVITGHLRDETAPPLYIGSDKALTLPESDARAFFLEFSGAGMGTLTALEAAKRDKMAVLGARILQSDKRMVESAETAELNRQGEHSSLASIAITISKAITQKLKLAATWSGVSEEAVEEVAFSLNTDYFPKPIGAQDLMAIVKAWQDGTLTWEELTTFLQRGGIADEDLSPEQRREIIDQDPARLTFNFGGAE